MRDPGYLRAVALDEYDAENGWTLSNLDGEESIADEGRLAPLPLEQSPPGDRHDPGAPARRPLPADAVLAARRCALEDGGPDDWRFDPATGTVFGRDVTSAGPELPRVGASSRGPPSPSWPAPPAARRDDVQQRFTALPPLDPPRSPTSSPR